jgi:hypothetical protein
MVKTYVIVSAALVDVGVTGALLDTELDAAPIIFTLSFAGVVGGGIA